MRFSIEWRDDAENASLEERATVADLKAWIGDTNACAHIEEIEGRGSVFYEELTIGLVSLAEGLARDWWSIFGSRDRVHRLIRHRMGFIVPSIEFSYDGEMFKVQAPQHFYKNPDIRFFHAGPEEMKRVDAEATLGGFIGDVLDRLRAKEIEQSTLELRWDRVRNSLADPDERAFCEAAGALLLDPYQIEEGAAALIENAGAYFSNELLIEFLAGVASQQNKDAAVQWVDAVDKRKNYTSVLNDLGGLSRQIAQDVPSAFGEPSWAQGYKCARRAQALLDVKSGHRPKSVTELARKLGSPGFRSTPGVPGVRALIANDNDRVHIHLKSRAKAGQHAREGALFAFARAIGDVICFPGTAYAVVNDLHHARRQAAGRAFAAEFLAPIDEVLSMKADGLEVSSIADEFMVSTEVIERQLENQQRILKACA